jgi:hypothetical protein
MAYDMENTTYPILLSCACDAATFSKNDAAGERFLKAPKGGGIAYMGNGTTGLGLAGGSQFIDEMIRYLRDSAPNPLLAQVFRSAHDAMPQSDSITIPVGIGDIPIPLVDQNSYRWTQKAVVLLGDGLIPIWTQALAAGPKVTVTKKAVCEGFELTFTFAQQVSGTLHFAVNGREYETLIPATNSAVATVTDKTLTTVTYGLVPNGTQPVYGEAKP